MTDQHVVVFLLEGVYTAKDALGLEKAVTIGGVECRALLPVQDEKWRMSLHAPPVPGGNQVPLWSGRFWGDTASAGGIVKAVGVILTGTVIPPGDEHIAFDHAAAQWRKLLRDWLSVLAEGPTDWAKDYYGATAFPGPGYDGDYDGLDVPYEPVERGHRHPLRRLSAWSWGHALGHASTGDQPPLSRVLMTSAVQATMDANWRVAVIDAATATEAALTAGLVAELSKTLSPSDVTRKLDERQNRMLGNRIRLAGTLGMVLPAGIQQDLVDPRNAAMHQGAEVTRDQVKAAITAAWAVVRQYAPLPACCHEPGPGQGA
jgi:hypothetical protein